MPNKRTWFHAILLLVCLLASGTVFAFDFDFDAAHAKIMDRQAALERNDAGMSETERLNAVIELWFDYTMLEFPEFATFIGEPEGHDRWTDNSLAAIARRKDETRSGLALLRGIDRDELEGVDRLNYDLLLQQTEDQVAGFKFQGDYLVVNQLGGIHQNTAQMFAMMPAQTEAHYADIMARLRGVRRQVANVLTLLRMGLERGVTPPKVTLRDVPQQVENLLTEEPLQSPLLRPFANIPDSIPARTRKRLQKQAVKVYQDELRPAFQELHDYLVATYIPGSREAIAMNALPDGDAWYAYNVQQMTTTDLTPRQIHQIGLSEVKRIRAEMDEVIAAAGFEGSFEDFTDFLRTDPQFYFDDPDALLTAYRDIAKRADAATVKVVGKLPRLPYGVVKVPSYAEKSQTTAYYMPGSTEAGRPGEFFANTYNLKTRPKWEMEALTLHEAVPGHHLQIALQQELEDMAWFRRFGGYTAFSEGWGLYSESLGTEMGFYQDPYSRFGQLTYEMWRAIRLVVDTGMHSLNWSRQEAIDYFMANAGKTEHDVVVEIDRYIVWPGQALAYKIGELKIKELRAKAESALGDAFDLRVFHDAVLGNGAVPLSVLEKQIDDWILGAGH